MHASIDTRVARVLVVDDDRDTVEMMEHYFTAQGLDVVTARNGSDALLLAHYARPDVVLLDIKMPGMNGDEVLSDLRLRWPELPVIMLSGIVDAERARRTLQRGAFDYLCKPLEWDRLSECVTAALATSGHRGDSAAAKYSMSPPLISRAPLAPSDIVLPESIPMPLRGLHVLVVDDNEDTREMLRRLLSFSGAFVTAVPGAEAALDVLRVINPNVIVSDLSMPQHDGFWLMAMMARERAGLPTIPSIAMTAYRESQPEARAYESGFAAYLEKPLDFRRLLATIQKVVGRQAA